MDDSSDEVQENIIMNARVMRLMKQKLPSYIVKCVVSAGFDEVEVLCSMDTSENPSNSIERIEKYIERKFASSPEHNPFSSSPFEFSPGHRIRLCNFIREVKSLCRNKGDVKVYSKRKMDSQFHKANKKRKVAENSDESTTAVITLADVSKQVRSNLRKWMRRQEKSYLQEMTEGEHYSLQIVPKDHPGDFEASIRCLKCGNSILLQKNNQSYSNSNFYRHVDLCLGKSSGKSEKKKESKDGKKLSQTDLGVFFTEPLASKGNGSSSSRTRTHLGCAASSLIDLTGSSANHSQASASSDTSESQGF